MVACGVGLGCVKSIWILMICGWCCVVCTCTDMCNPLLKCAGMY